VRRLADGRIQFEGPADVPPVALSLSSTAFNRTGDWRSREPVFGDLTPPCAAACPAGQDVVDQVRLLSQGRVREAGQVVLAANPFPAITGRVCPHPCTAACNRGKMEGPVDIPGVERALGDLVLAERVELPRSPETGARVAVVGAGPAGLTAAHYLGLGGCEVTLYDRSDRPGGLLSAGIPPYRLPRAVVEAEVARALRPGVRFAGQRWLGRDLEVEALSREFDAVLLAVGRHAPRRLGVPGEGASGVVDGLELLSAREPPLAAPARRRAVVVGGGNTALDCARSLRRAGFEVTVAYRRGRADMPAFADEVQEALEEGVALEDWLLPAEVVTREGRASALRCLRARPGEPDGSGRPRPVPVPGSERTLDADLVVAAAGEELDRGGLPESWVERGRVVPGPAFAGRVLAIGDCAGAGGTVAHAIGEGRRAAAALATGLGCAAPATNLLAERGAAPEVAGFERVRPAWHRPAVPWARGREDAVLRRQDEREVRLGFTREEALREASRCLACGTCAGCELCYQLCPDRAVVRGAPGAYSVDASRCKGCGVCVEECPRGALALRERGGA